MPVHREDLLTSVLMAQQHGLFHLRAVEKRLGTPGHVVETQVKVLTHILGVAQLHVMVAVDADISLLEVELADQLEDLGICLEDVVELRVLPQLVVVARLDEGELLVEVVLQRRLEDVTVLVELVGQATIAAVRVTENHDLGRRVDLEQSSISVCPGESRHGSHGFLPFANPYDYRA